MCHILVVFHLVCVSLEGEDSWTGVQYTNYCTHSQIPPKLRKVILELLRSIGTTEELNLSTQTYEFIFSRQGKNCYE